LLTSPAAGQLKPPATSEIGKYIVVKTRGLAQFGISIEGWYNPHKNHYFICLLYIEIVSNKSVEKSVPIMYNCQKE